MSVPGTFEMILIVLVFVVLITLAILSVKKLLKSNLSQQAKTTWMVVMIVFQLLGVLAFILYHDLFLSRESRANL